MRCVHARRHSSVLQLAGFSSTAFRCVLSFRSFRSSSTCRSRSEKSITPVPRRRRLLLARVQLLGRGEQVAGVVGRFRQLPNRIDRGLLLEFLARLQPQHRKNLVLHVLRQLVEGHGQRNVDLGRRNRGLRLFRVDVAIRVTNPANRTQGEPHHLAKIDQLRSRERLSETRLCVTSMRLLLHA